MTEANNDRLNWGDGNADLRMADLRMGVVAEDAWPVAEEVLGATLLEDFLLTMMGDSRDFKKQ